MSINRTRSPLPASDRAALESHVELSQFELHSPSIRLLPQQFCLKHQLIILNRVDNTPGQNHPVTVAMLRTDDRALLEQLRLHLKREVNPVQLSSYEIRKAHAMAFGEQTDSLNIAKTSASQMLQVRATNRVSYEVKDAVELLNQILGCAITMGASDLHIESYTDDVDVRVRIDGMLHQINTPASPEMVKQMSSRLKVLAGLDLTERSRALDGRVNINFIDQGRSKQIGARLSTLPAAAGEDLVLRFSTLDSAGLRIDDLGLDRRELLLFKNLVRSPEGLLIFSGPTGSGKTSSMYACIRELSDAGLKIISIEDPVEQLLPKVNQKEVTEKMSFADYVRATLRQDPDVIVIGEIRDAETAEVALRAAYTGIMVFASLHASDAVRTFMRLKALVADQDLVHNSVLGILNQRLVRRLCPSCSTAKEVSDKLRLSLGEVAENSTFYTGSGCESCAGRGYAGRLGIFELLAMDDKLVELFNSNTSISDIRDYLKARGSRSLFEHAVERASSAETSLEEVFRVIPYRNSPLGK